MRKRERERYCVFGNELRWRWWQRKEFFFSQEFRRLKINPESKDLEKNTKI